MAKFIKSIFHTSDRRKSRYEECEEDKANQVPPLDSRRKLSISRSGRMKQANKKRHSLSLEVYNQEQQMAEKTINSDLEPTVETKKVERKRERSQSIEIKTPEEEIDRAFEIIDKT